MDNKNNWKITVIEHCIFKDEAISQVYYGAHNQGTADLPANLTVIQGSNKNILYDVGFYNPKFIESNNAINVLSPKEYLALVDLTPEDIDVVILSHMHFDHAGNIDAFPNAKIYVQRKEYDGWSWAMSLPPKFAWITNALDEQDVDNLKKINNEGRLVLVDEDEFEAEKGIKLHLAKGHTFGSQVVTIDTKNGVYVAAADALYAMKNLKEMIPMGYGEDQIEQLITFDLILSLADGRYDHIIPGHDLTWPQSISSTQQIGKLENRITVVNE